MNHKIEEGKKVLKATMDFWIQSWQNGLCAFVLFVLFCFLFSFAVLFIYLLTFFNCCSSTVVSIPPVHHSHPDFPSLILPPFWFCLCVLYRWSWKPFSLFLPLSAPTSTLVTVSLFLISVSGYILLACLFCWLGST